MSRSRSQPAVPRQPDTANLPPFLEELVEGSVLPRETAVSLAENGFASPEALAAVPTEVRELQKQLEGVVCVDKIGVAYSVKVAIEKLQAALSSTSRLAVGQPQHMPVDQAPVQEAIDRLENNIGLLDGAIDHVVTDGANANSGVTARFPALIEATKRKSDKEPRDSTETKRNFTTLNYNAWRHMVSLTRAEGGSARVHEFADTMLFLASKALYFKGSAIVTLAEKIYEDSASSDVPINDRNFLSNLAIDHLNPGDKWAPDRAPTEHARGPRMRPSCYRFNKGICPDGSLFLNCPFARYADSSI